MRYILTLALKNILRSKRRTILTFLMLTFGSMFYIVISGLYAGMDKESFENLIEFDTGHIKVRLAEYDEERPYSTDNLILDYKKAEEIIASQPFVKGYTRRVEFFGEIDNYIDSTPVVIVGVDLEKDSEVFSLNKFISEGTLEPDGAIIGYQLAKEMGLQLYDTFNLTFYTRDGMLSGLTLPITGILFSGDPLSNRSKVFIPMGTAVDALAVDAVSSITIKTDNLDKSADYAGLLNSKLDGLIAHDWKSLSYEFADIVNTKKKASGVILFIIIVIAMVGVVNTILISIYEKRREIGTLKAMGMLDSEVRNLFIAEGFIIGLIGSLVGVLIGGLANIYFVNVGLDYTEMMEDMSGELGASMIGVLKSAWVIADFVKIIVISVIASTLASYYPARKVMKMEPADCLRTV